MGCDIHTRIEYYNKSTDKWTDCSPKDEGVMGSRIYELFAILADVRNRGGYIKCICEPKGLPVDCSESIRADHDSWNADAHSASYFTVAELLTAIEQNYDEPYLSLTNFTKALQTHACTFLAPLVMVESNFEDICKNNVRVVFWFDN